AGRLRGLAPLEPDDGALSLPGSRAALWGTDALCRTQPPGRVAGWTGFQWRSLALHQVAHDWQERYGYRPLLVETFVEAERFTGACYRAANWREVGQTVGRGRQDREHRGGRAVKRVFLYALHAQARQRLGGQAPAPPPPPADWAEGEFGGACLGNKRLGERLLTLARDFYARPQANLPQACQTRARTKAAYYFFEHPDTSMDALLEP